MSERQIITTKARYEVTPRIGDTIIPEIGPDGVLTGEYEFIPHGRLADLYPAVWMVYGPGGWMIKAKPGYGVVRIQEDEVKP